MEEQTTIDEIRKKLEVLPELEFKEAWELIKSLEDYQNIQIDVGLLPSIRIYDLAVDEGTEIHMYKAPLKDIAESDLGIYLNEHYFERPKEACDWEE